MDISIKLQNKKASPIFISLSFLFLISFHLIISIPSPQSNNPTSLSITKTDDCTVFRQSNDKCAYVKSHIGCKGKGYINYLEIFYCSCIDSSYLGYIVLTLWLLVLFYVLGNTTADYFCPSVEGLSMVLKLSPTIAGTTLLPLGNGANDVFASIISFTRSGEGDVGLNSVLGGALFIACFVVGVISISISSKRVRVDESSFIRDALFFLFTLCCLLVIILFGKINLWFAIGFISIYLIYIAVVSLMQLFYKKKERVVKNDEFDAIGIPLLGYVDEEKGCVQEKDRFQDQDNHSPITRLCSLKPSSFSYLNLFIYVLELPLVLPRRITIPVVSEEKWSKPFATLSATLSPILLATLWNSQGEKTNATLNLAISTTSIVLGVILGIMALIFTKRSSPPKRFLFPWLAGGFLMSITWTYIIVQELVSLLVAFGDILGISPSILGLTVLAWGNSIGDLISNMTMALKGGADGAQVAMSGCYAGPLFNTLVGLGLSLVLATWNVYPLGFEIPKDSEIYETVGFLMGGLLWALVILPKRDMQLDKFLGIGLISIYFCFLFVRLVRSVGLVNLGNSFDLNNLLIKVGSFPRL